MVVLRVRGGALSTARRAAGLLGAWLAAAAPAAAQALPVPREEQEPRAEEPLPPFTGIAGRVGASQRLDHGTGRTIPLAVLVYRTRDAFGEGFRADVRYLASSLEFECRTPEAGALLAGALAEMEVGSTDHSPYRYVDGRYQRRRVFYTSNAGGSLFAGRQSGDTRAGRGELLVRWRARRYLFGDAPDTHAGFVLPDDLTEQRVSLEATWERLAYFRNFEIAEGGSASLVAIYAHRDRWRPFGDEPATLAGDLRPFQEFTTLVLRTGVYRRLGADHNARLELVAAAGDDLDRLSGFAVGSIFGGFPITGYYYAELKADRALLLNAQYGADLPFFGLRAYGYLDTGLFRELGRDPHWRTGLGAGVRIGIPVDAKRKLPLLIRYGYAPRAHRGASRGGHELAIVASFAL